jgi:hypothetical protein
MWRQGLVLVLGITSMLVCRAIKLGLGGLRSGLLIEVSHIKLEYLLLHLCVAVRFVCVGYELAINVQ